MWKLRLKLEEDDTIRFDSKYEKGNLGQEEVEIYSVLNYKGEVTSSIQYTCHTSIKAPFQQSFHLVQRGDTGQTIIDETWSK
jgi:hypothetical protein